MNLPRLPYSLLIIPCLIVTIAGLVGCATPTYMHADKMAYKSEIYVGMTRADVIRVMKSEPAKREVSGPKEFLHWCATGYAPLSRIGKTVSCTQSEISDGGCPRNNEYLMIYLQNSKVTDIRSYENSFATSDCREKFRQPQFNSPDHIQEIRVR